MESLKGLQKDMKTYKYVRPEDRRKNIDIAIGLIQRYFVHKEPPVLSHGPGLALEFENSLRRSRIETPRYEFKQGILDLNEQRKINSNLLSRLVETTCGMANLGPNSEGYIYLGVADKKNDAERIKQLDGIDYIDISGHYVIGIERECVILKWSIEQYVDKIVGSIRSSKLSDPLRTQILTQIDIINYKSYTAIRIKIPTQSRMSFVGDTAFAREGNETIEIKGPKLIAISDLFK